MTLTGSAGHICSRLNPRSPLQTHRVLTRIGGYWVGDPRSQVFSHHILSRTQAPGPAKVIPSRDLTVKSFLLCSWKPNVTKEPGVREVANTIPVYQTVPRLCEQAP